MLLYTIERSGYTLPDHKSQTYDSILQTCCWLKMIESSRKSLVLPIYLHLINVSPKPIKVSVRKITAVFDLASGVVTEIAQYVNSPPRWNPPCRGEGAYHQEVIHQRASTGRARRSVATSSDKD